jgi:hypothetical protein
MAVNIAAKRGAKAQRRKAVVAAKRAVERAGSGLAGRVREAAAMPIQHCLVSQTLESASMSTLVLARGNSPAVSHVGLFLLDTMGVGVKDVSFQTLEEPSFRLYRESLEAAMPIAEIDPADARKLLQDVVVTSVRMGLQPHREFAAIEKLFGNVVPSDRVFNLGRAALSERLGYAEDQSPDEADAESGIGPDGDALAAPAVQPDAESGSRSMADLDTPSPAASAAHLQVASSPKAEA